MKKKLGSRLISGSLSISFFVVLRFQYFFPLSALQGFSDILFGTRATATIESKSGDAAVLMQQQETPSP